MKAKKITTVNLDVDLLGEVDQFAATMGTPRSWAVATLLRAALASRPEGNAASENHDRSST